MRTNQITLKKSAIAIAVAVILDLIIFAIGSAAGANWDAGSPYPITSFMVAMFSAVPLALAAVIVAFITRKKPGFQKFAAWAGLAFALITIAGSLTMAPQLLTGLSLGSMHIVVGVLWFWLANPGKTNS